MSEHSWKDEDVHEYIFIYDGGMADCAIELFCPHIEHDKNGHAVLDLSKIDDEGLEGDLCKLYNELWKSPKNVLGLLTAWARHQDEFRDDTVVTLKGDCEDARDIRSIGQSDRKELVKFQARVMDTTDSTAAQMIATFECQQRHDVTKAQSRATPELDRPASCPEEKANGETCNAPIMGPVEHSDNVYTDVQQVVFAEIDEDDSNSRKLIGEVDAPLINSVERDDVVTVWAIPMVPQTNATKKEMYLHIVGLSKVDDDEVEVSDEDIETLEGIVEETENPVERVAKSIAPHIVERNGQDRGRLALACALVGGRKTGAADGRIHVLLLGEPATGKTDLIRGAQNLVNGDFVDGGQATQAGLTGSVRYSSMLQGDDTVMVASGAIPRAHESVLALDELDKTHWETQAALNTPLQSGQVTITKDGKSELDAHTTVIAAANPKGELFDIVEPPIAQQPINDSLFSRFSHVVVIRDNVEKTVEKEMKEMDKEMSRSEGELPEYVIEEETLKKYIAHASELEPVMSRAAQLFLKKKLSEMRVAASDVAVDGLTVSGRVRETLIDTSYAMAKLRLSERVTVTDAERAFNLLAECWDELAGDELNDLDTVEEIAVSHSLASNPSQRQVVQQALSTLRLHAGSELDANVFYDSIDADGKVVDFVIQSLEEKGHIRRDNDKVEVIDLPSGGEAA